MVDAKRNKAPAQQGITPAGSSEDLPEEQDLDDLVIALNASSSPSPDTRVEAWISAMLERGASDLFLVSGDRPLVRIDGRLERLEGPVLDGDDITAAIVPLLPAALRQRYLRDRSVDASVEWPPAGRLRVNLHQERGRPAASLRPVPTIRRTSTRYGCLLT